MADDLPRITILSAESGGGHRAAATSLTEALDGRARVSCISLLDDHAPFPFNTWSGLYGPLVNVAPRLYRLLYDYAGSRARLLRTLHAVYPVVKRRVIAGLVAERPDLVISVHPLQTDIVHWALADSGRPVPFMIVVTDPVTASAAWFCPGADRCVVATEPAHAAALACGVPPERARIIGLPVRRAFAAAEDRPKPAVRRDLGLPEGRPLVLLMGGGAGVGRIKALAQTVADKLARHPAAPQLAIIAGRNERLRRRLASARWPLPVTVLGFVERMADWLAASDLLITKAGPGTLAEAACLGVPALITGFIPGQEDGNVTWAQEQGAGIFEPDPARVAALAAELLQPGAAGLAQMAGRARAIARPRAAAEIAELALTLLPGAAARNLDARQSIKTACNHSQGAQI